MTGQQAVEIRGGVATVLAIASVAAWRVAPRLRFDSQAFRRFFLAAFATSRIGLFVLAYGILHLIPHGDISLYMEEAAPALAGKLIYRDFITPHAPLDPYLLSSMLRLHHSPLTIMFFGVLFDCLAMFVWMRVLPHFLDTLTLRRAALLVLFSPTSMLTEAIDGQMNAFIALFLALAVYCLVRNRAFLSGAAAAVPAAVIKFITLIYAPGFLFASRKKLLATLGFVAVLLAVYVPFSLAGANILTPLSAEGSHLTSSNIPFLFELLTGHSLGLRLPDLILALAWFSVVAVVFLAMRSPAVAGENTESRRRTFLILTLSLIAELFCIIVFSKNTWDRFLVMAMFPLCIVAARFTFGQITAYALWLIAVCVESSFWAVNLTMQTSTALHRLLRAGDRPTLLFTLIQIVCVVGDLFIFASVLRFILALRKPLPDPAITHPDIPLLEPA